LDEVSTVDTITSTSSGEAPLKPGGLATKVSKNVAISLSRVAFNSLVALVLPAYLTHHLPVATYGAWVLILQLGAFVLFLDIGIQTGVAKFVAEHDARGDIAEAGRHASAGFAMMALAGLLGLSLTATLAWQVPRLFHSMPEALYHDVRISVLMVGGSLSFVLVCSVFAGVFIGLQQYGIPTAITILNRSLYTLAVCITVYFKGSLIAMGAVVALINVTTGSLQVHAWRRKLSRIRISLMGVDPKILKQMFSYCLALAIWSAAMLCISGLDVTIVGHYDFKETAYYSLATLPANLIISIISSSLGPMLPAASALSTQRSPAAMGNILFRITRYSTILILLTGLPLLVGGYPILHLWVGRTYAFHSVRYLQVLVLATIIRHLCMPYATIVVATGKQRLATASAIAEAVVNLVSSIYLAHSLGAVGVAVGTLLGAFVSVGMHFIFSMRYTSTTILVSRIRLFVGAILRPASIAIPSLLLFPFWGKSYWQPLDLRLWIFWAIATLLITWFGTLKADERTALLKIIGYKIKQPVQQGQA
jgi:O-antigen/teichoic acid export membrane protein